MDKKGVLYFNVSSDKPRVPAAITFSSADVGTALIECQMIRHGLPWTLPKGTTGIIQLTMADGKKYTDNVELIIRKEGIVQYTLSSEQLKHPGTANGELFITDEKERLFVGSFLVHIEDHSIGGGEIGNGVPDIKFSIDKNGNLLMTHSEKDTLDFSINESGELEVKTWQ